MYKKRKDTASVKDEIKIFRQARDGTKLVEKWHQEMLTSNKKYPHIEPLSKELDDEVNRAKFFYAFVTWLLIRGLDDKVHLEETYASGWMCYKMNEFAITHEHLMGNFETEFHGTNFYALPGIMHARCILASEKQEVGHRILDDKPGSYFSPALNGTMTYAVAHKGVHGDQQWSRCVVECFVDRDKLKHSKKQDNGVKQHVYAEKDTQVRAIWINPNYPPCAGEFRFDGWKPELEIRRPGIPEYPRMCLKTDGFYGPARGSKR